MKSILQKFLRRFASDILILFSDDDAPIIPSFKEADIEAAIKARDDATDEQRLLLRKVEFYQILETMHGEFQKATTMHYGQRKDAEIRIRSGQAFMFRAFKGLDLRNLQRSICCPYCIFIDCRFDGEILEGSNLEGVVIDEGIGSVRIARRSRLRNMDSLMIMRKEECLEDQKEGLLDGLDSHSLVN